MDIKSMLRTKRKMKRKKPKFMREEIHRQKTLKSCWRKPRGKQSKLRKRQKARGRLPKAGYGSPVAVRGLNRMGLAEVRVCTPSQLEGIDPKKEAVVIASGVGRVKRSKIVDAARKMGAKVINA